MNPRLWAEARGRMVHWQRTRQAAADLFSPLVHMSLRAVIIIASIMIRLESGRRRVTA
jgi:hypothetical protein